MIVRKLRLQKGWSQDQLAQLSGLSVPTIQRIERGQKAGLESLKSLAAVFEVQVIDLKQEAVMTTERECLENEERVIEYVRDIKGFYSHLITYILVIGGLFALNLITSPEYIWAKWAALGWGIGIVSHGLNVFEIFNFFGPDWEKNKLKKSWVKSCKTHNNFVQLTFWSTFRFGVATPLYPKTPLQPKRN